MQKIKDSKGITLVVLVITVIVLLILATITIRYGIEEVHEVSNKKMETDLKVVQQSIMQRYALLQSKGLLNIKAPDINNDASIQDSSETSRPEGLLGTRVADPKKTLDIYSFPTDIKLKSDYTASDSVSYSATYSFEAYYYLLDENDLSDLGITAESNFQSSDLYASEQYKFMVNYSTGEVFDIANKRYWDNKYLNDLFIYDQPANVSVDLDSQNYVFSDD